MENAITQSIVKERRFHSIFTTPTSEPKTRNAKSKTLIALGSGDIPFSISEDPNIPIFIIIFDTDIRDSLLINNSHARLRFELVINNIYAISKQHTGLKQVLVIKNSQLYGIHGI